jgi:hypothetical protein
LAVDLSSEIVAEYVGRLYPDVVVDSKDRISTRFSSLKFEMSLGKEAV